MPGRHPEVGDLRARSSSRSSSGWGSPPQTVLAAYRVGDSPINVITPLMVYLPFIVVGRPALPEGRRHRHDHRADAARTPSIVLGLVDPSSSSLWFLLGIPLGPGLPGPALTGRAAVRWADVMSDITIVLPRSWSVGRRRCSSGTGSRSGSSRSAPPWPCGPRACSTLDQALAGFGDPAVIFIATLFVVSEGLDATGVTAWAGQQLDRAGRRRAGPRLLVADDAARRRR